MDIKIDEAALTAIGEGAAAAEQEQAAQATGQGDQVQLTDAQKWAAIPAVLGSVLCIALPELKEAYKPANCEAWGEAMAPLAEKHGWSPDSAVGPELGVAVASLPMVIPSVLVVLQRRKVAREAREAAAAVRAAQDAKNGPAMVLDQGGGADAPGAKSASPAVELEKAGVFGI